MASQTTKINDNNLMLYVGTYFQFKQWDGNALCLSLLYGKGLSKLQETTINYQLGQGNYQHIISSNGDIFVAQISIPIRLSKRRENISNDE